MFYLGAEFPTCPAPAATWANSWLGTRVAQKKVWGVKEDLPFNGGTLTTAGGLVFCGNLHGVLPGHRRQGRQGAVEDEAGFWHRRGTDSYSVGGKHMSPGGRPHGFDGGLRRRRRDEDAEGNARRRRGLRVLGRLSQRGGREGEGDAVQIVTAGVFCLRPRLGGVLREFASHARAGCSRRSQGLAPVRGPRRNWPFSSHGTAKPGIYNEIGEAIGRALGRPVTYVWYRTYFGARAVRATMLAKQCDAMIGLPNSDAFMGPKVIFSKPLFNLGYAIVAPKGQSFANVEDLKGKRVAVQFETEPQNIVGPCDHMTPVTVLSAEEGMKALAEGRADCRVPGRRRLAISTRPPTTAASRSSRSTARTSLGRTRLATPSASASLRDADDEVFPEVLKTFPALFAKYGFATVGPVVEKTVVIEKAAAVVAQAAATSASPLPPKRRRLRPSNRCPRPGQACRRRNGRVRRGAIGAACYARDDRGRQGGVQRQLRPLPRSGRGDGPKAR